MVVGGQLIISSRTIIERSKSLFFSKCGRINAAKDICVKDLKQEFGPGAKTTNLV